MNTFQKFQIAKAAILQAKEIIGLIDRPCDALDYGDFETPELRDLYYTLNDYWLTLHAMQNREEVAPCDEIMPCDLDPFGECPKPEYARNCAKCRGWTQAEAEANATDS